MGLEAGQPEILRASQRDAVFKKRLSDNAAQLLSSFLGVRQWIKWRSSTEIASNFVYQALTTLGDLQTLGEEYTGITQFTAAQKLPSKQIRLIFILLDCFGERVVINLINRFEEKLNNLPPDHELRPEAKSALLKCCHQFKRMLPFFIRLHQAVFYFQGRYYQLSKRVTGIQYILVRFWLRNRSVLPTFQVLGVISFLHLAVTGLAALKHSPVIPPKEPRSSVVASSAANCALCLNPRLHTSCTPCGHLFCWYCIVPWVQEQPFCPLCRQTVLPSRIVLLHNYSE